MGKLEYVKACPVFYAPGTEPGLVDVPEMVFLQVVGSGDPNDPEGEYVRALELLNALSYTIKMAPKGGHTPEGYIEYAVPPLEGLWEFGDGAADLATADKGQFRWTAMIRQPEFVTDGVLDWAAGEVFRKKKLDASRARLARFREGLCVQCMHIGSYASEPRTVERMHAYLEANGFLCDFSEVRRHHEIYLGDPRQTAPEKLRTVLRHPVRRA
jgi:hypothetical protein